MRYLIIILILGISVTAFPQEKKKKKKELIENKEQVAARATVELDEAMNGPEGELYLLGQEYDINGEYTFDITIHEKGLISSVFVIGNNNGTISSQNRLKDYIKHEFKFNFKVPKGNRYKFQYTFKFD